MSKPSDSENELKWQRGSEESPPPKDGREARAERTKKLVADALIDLIEEGDLRPTSKAIAERAGVSERTIFQHFADLETLFDVSARRLGERIVQKRVYIPDQGPFEARLKAHLDEMIYLAQAMTPVRQASRLHEPFSPVLRKALRTWRDELRNGIDRVYGSELSVFSPERRTEAVEALALLATWSSWDNMLRNSCLEPERARSVIEFGFRAVLGQPQPSPEA